MTRLKVPLPDILNNSARFLGNKRLGFINTRPQATIKQVRQEETPPKWAEKEREETLNTPSRSKQKFNTEGLLNILYNALEQLGVLEDYAYL